MSISNLQHVPIHLDRPQYILHTMLTHYIRIQYAHTMYLLPCSLYTISTLKFYISSHPFILAYDRQW